MPITKSDAKGFTLIEVIVTLLLVGITAALAGGWIVWVVNGYGLVKTNAETTQKAQLAMIRLVREFVSIKSIDTNTIYTNGSQIKYKRTTPTLGVTADYTVVFQNGEVQINGHTLTDKVSDFKLRYCGSNDLACDAVAWKPGVSKSIEMTLSIVGMPIPFTQRVIPRNI